MYTLNLNYKFQNVDGSILENNQADIQDNDQITAAKVLGQLLFSSENRPFNPIKTYIMAQNLYSKGFVEIDEANVADLKQLEKFVVDSRISSGYAAQIVQSIQDAVKPVSIAEVNA